MKNLLFGILLIVVSCSNPFYREIDKEKPSETRSFNYETTKEVEVNIFNLFKGVPVDLFYSGIKRATFISDNNGEIRGEISLPTHVDMVTLKTNYLGLPHEVKTRVDGSINYSYFISEELEVESTTRALFSRNRNSSENNYNTLGSWNSDGVPDYLLEREELSTDFLNLLNSILPENQPVPEFNPQYLESNAVTDIHILEEAEVYVTFIHEGAGYKNALGFISYNSADGVPESVDSSDITLIYPNVSYVGGGGGLQSGDRVKIGTFQEGTTISWVLITDGYTTSSESVGDGRNKFYSIDELNPESEEFNQHVVQISFENRVVFAFEDLLRPDGDNDFNDAIFSASSNPLTAIDRSMIITPEESSTIDSDGDGVIDTLDPEPENPDVSAVDYYPGESASGALAYEDLWPYKGDYDFNDLIVDINFEEKKNSSDEIVSIKGTFLIKAMLASMRNGFAVELGVAPDKVSSVTGGEFSRGYIKREINGVEERQDKAVIGIFEDATLHYNGLTGEEIVVEISFTSPVTRSELGFPPYNPFVISNGERGREVHLPGKSHTSLAHLDYFLTEDDNSTFENGESYKTAENSPWAIHIPGDFKYPKDDVEISRVYNYFGNWVESSGELFTDWYLDDPGNINHELLFNP